MVPKGWEEKPLIKLLDKIIDYRGQSVPKAEDGIPLITARNVRFGYLDFSNQEYVDEGEFENWMSRGIPDVGDILFTTEAPLGMACRFPKKGRYAVAQRTVTLRTSNQLHSDFLLYFLLSEHGQRLIDIRSSGSTAKGIKSAELKKVKLLHPICINEQQKIASILSTWDKAISTTERLIENSTQQKKALMQQLLTGKKRLLDESGKRFESEWNCVNLEDVCDVKGGKRLPKGNAVSEDITPHPYIRVADMYMGGVDLSDIKYVPESIAPLIKNYTISKDDLFITVAGTLGIVGSIPDDLDGANLTENADKLTNIKCDKAFLLYVMTSSVIQRYIEAESTQNAQPKLALARIRGFKVPLPNPEEQQKIATVLTDADREIELLAQQLADLQQEKKALMQVLLTGKKRVVVDEEVV